MTVLFLTIGSISENAMMKRAAGMAPRIAKEGHEVVIIASDTKENREYIPSRSGIKREFITCEHMLEEIVKKIGTLKQFDPDISYACGWGLRNLSVFAGRKSIIEHAEMHSENYESSAVQRQKNFILEWISVLFGDGLVLASSYLLKKYEKKDITDTTQKKYLPYGVKCKHQSDHKKEFEDDFKKESKICNVTYMGSLYESYGIMEIVKSIPYVLKKKPDIEFIILGDGPDREKAESLANSLGVSNFVKFRGYVDGEELNRFLSSADIFLAPLRNTVKDKARCPSKIPEYMCYRKPIVTCRVGEAPTYLGEHGFYYEPNDPRSMAMQIVQATDSSSLVEYNIDRVRWSSLAVDFLKWVQQDMNI